MNYHKIMIFGRPGSGKSTFALRLHKFTKIPLYHLDKHFYEANWRQRNYQEFMKIQQSIANQNEWIVDGNCTKSLELRYSHADLVLYFNYPRWLCYLRVFKRLWNKNSEIDDRALGCKETVRFSLLRYMWSFEGRVRDQISYLKEKFPKVKFMEITNDMRLHSIFNAMLTEVEK
jgi:adenylate kinase family enzyme